MRGSVAAVASWVVMAAAVSAVGLAGEPAERVAGRAIRRTSVMQRVPRGFTGAAPAPPFPAARPALPPRGRLPHRAPSPPSPLRAGEPAPPPVPLPAEGAPAPRADGTIQFDLLATLGTAATGASTSTVCEPTVAMTGDTLLVTGNWFASLSTDGGASFTPISPFTFFPSTGGGFCCDQVAVYAPSADLFCWLLQYVKDGRGENIQRLAVATSAGAAAGDWVWLDIPSSTVGGPGNWLDFPALAAGTNALYLTTNVFDSGGRFVKAAILRFPLAGLAAGGAVSWDFWTTPADSGIRPAQGLGTRLYAAAVRPPSELGVYYVDEGDGTLHTASVAVGSFDSSSYSSLDPDGVDWMWDSDSRMLGAALAGGELWFAWNAGSGGRHSLPHPYAEVARIRESDFALVAQPILWNLDFAIAFPALAASDAGEIGASLAFGGGTAYPSHMVGILTGTPRYATTVQGTASPLSGRFGDYLWIARSHPDGSKFVATGYALKGGHGNSSVVPVAAKFGRSAASGGFSVSGTLTDGAGRGIPGVAVGAGLETATTDATGQYTLAGLGAGTWEVVPLSGSLVFEPLVRTVTVGPDATGADFTARPRTILLQTARGTLKDAALYGRDRFRARGTFLFTAATPDGSFSPSTDALAVYVGGLLDGIGIAVPAGDAGWRVRGGRMTWKSPRGRLPKAKIVLDTSTLSWSIAIAQANLPAAAENPVVLRVEFGDDLGFLSQDWTWKRSDTLAY